MKFRDPSFEVTLKFAGVTHLRGLSPDRPEILSLSCLTAHLSPMNTKVDMSTQINSKRSDGSVTLPSFLNRALSCLSAHPSHPTLVCPLTDRSPELNPLPSPLTDRNQIIY